MKKMKFLLVGFSLFMAANTFAQESPARRGLSVSIGPEAAFPIGTFNDAFKIGFGGSAKLNIPVADYIDVSLSAGYIGFSEKSQPDSIAINKNSYTFIPFKGGIRFRTKGGFYVEPQAGYTQTKLSNTEGKGEFTYAGNVGYLIHRAIDIAVRYEAVAFKGESAKYLGLRVAYNIPFARAK